MKAEKRRNEEKEDKKLVSTAWLSSEFMPAPEGPSPLPLPIPPNTPGVALYGVAVEVVDDDEDDEVPVEVEGVVVTGELLLPDDALLNNYIHTKINPTLGI